MKLGHACPGMFPYLPGKETRFVQGSMCTELNMINLLPIAVSHYFLCFRRSIQVDSDQHLQHMLVTVLLLAEPLQGHTSSLPRSSENAAHQGALITTRLGMDMTIHPLGNLSGYLRAIGLVPPVTTGCKLHGEHLSYVNGPDKS